MKKYVEKNKVAPQQSLFPLRIYRTIIKRILEKNTNYFWRH